jgi:hypothetical protein
LITVGGFGLTIRSAIPVLGGAEKVDGPATITVERGTVQAWTAAIVDAPYRVASVDRFAFEMPDLAVFTCIDRNRIIVDAAPGADAQHLAEMLIATALPALLWARGGILLHAAAAIFPGSQSAVAVAGASGAGKSTWLAQAVAAGARIVADDTLHLKVADDIVTASGLPGGWLQRYGHEEHERRFHAVSGAQQCLQAPLGTLTILDQGKTERMSGPDAVVALLRHRHRPRVPGLLGLDLKVLSDIGRIAQLLQVFRGQPVNQPV